LNADPFPIALFLLAGLAAVVATGLTAAILYRVLGLARDRYEVNSGLAQLAEISWHELQVLIGLGLRSRGLGAIQSGDHEDTKSGAADLLLTDGQLLKLLRVKHGGGIQVDDHTIFDLATRRDARRASAAMLATTGKVSRLGSQAAKDANIELIAGDALWSLVSDHLPPRLRERIANRRRTTLRTRLGILIGSSALAGASALAVVVQLARSEVIFGPPARETPVAARPAEPPPSAPAEPAPAAVASTPVSAPTREPAQTRPEPLSEAEIQTRRREAATTVRSLPVITSARWSTASTLEVELLPNANLQDDSVFDFVCGVLAETDELSLSRVQIQLKDGDPSQGPIARWRQCQ